MKKKEMKELLAHVRCLYANLDDGTLKNEKLEEVVDAALFFHIEYDFDIDVLPENIYQGVVDKVHAMDEECYWDERAQSFVDAEFMHSC